MHEPVPEGYQGIYGNASACLAKAAMAFRMLPLPDTPHHDKEGKVWPEQQPEPRG